MSQSGHLNPDEKVQALEGRAGATTAFVEFADPTTRTALATSRGGTPQAVADGAEQQIESTASDVVAAIDGDVAVLYTAKHGLAGVAVTADADSLRALADRDDVISVRPIVPKELTSNAGIDLFTGAAASWQNAGITGEGQTIAVIDSGIDFTHASFNASPAYPYPSELNADTQTLLATAPAWPQGKVVGGYDFAGLTYTGGGTPAPDGNPLDEAPSICPATTNLAGGHGSHVAGTAAGYGVGADGLTFTGDYAALDAQSLLGLQVGPGSAPQADLVALKIFGCSGSSSVTGAALDWLLDPTNELAASVTVVNMSIGSDFSTVDDPENELIDELVSAGKVIVTSAGNAGDATDIGGSPGNANGSLSVANSVADSFLLQGARISLDGAPAEVFPGQYSIAYEFGSGPVGPLEVVTLTPGTLAYNSGCLPYTPEDAARVAGKSVVVAWDDTAPLPCGSAGRANNASNAGATGLIFTGLSEVFTAGLTGNNLIPTFQLTGPGTAQLLDYTPATGVITIPVPLTITFDPSASAPASAPSVADTLNTSSSRGVHGSLGSTKPDVAAPGTTIASVDVGSGNGWTNKSGTSMASPHAAGIAALTRQAHPDWSAAQVKAGVMNTASHDVTIDGVAFGPQRVGSGRVDGLAAVTNTVLAYDAEDPVGVSLAFGVVEISEATTSTRTLEVLNSGTQSVTLGLAYTPQTEVPGVDYVLSSDSVTVAAGATASVELSLVVSDPTALARTLDPTMEDTEPLYGQPREFLTTPQGWVELTGAPNVDRLRVPVSGSLKPVAEMAGGPVHFAGADAATASLELSGRGVDQDGFLSIVAPFQLAAESAKVNEGAQGSLLASDLKSVGISQYTGPYGPYVAFGVETYEPWATLGAASTFTIDIETPHGPYQVAVQKISDGIDYYDWTIVGVWDGAGDNQGLEYLNDVPASLDTNTFDSSAVALPVSLESLGFTPDQVASGEVSFTYTVNAHSWVAQSITGDDVYDSIEGLAYTWGAGLTFGDGGSAIFADLPGSSINVTRTPTGATSAEKVLLLHLHNAVGAQGQVIPITVEVPDTVRPGVNLIAPTTAGPFRTLEVQVDATDDRGLRRIVANIYQGSTLVKSTQTQVGGALAGTHRATVTLPDGNYTIKYNAQDLAGNISQTSTHAFTIDTVAPTVTIKTGSEFTVATGQTYDRVSFKLYDAGKIDKVTLNGVVKDLTNNAWSDVNFVKPGTFGAVKGLNSLVVYDVAGNSKEFTFTLN